jgi:hypothetical protein
LLRVFRAYSRIPLPQFRANFQDQPHASHFALENSGLCGAVLASSGDFWGPARPPRPANSLTAAGLLRRTLRATESIFRPHGAAFP